MLANLAVRQFDDLVSHIAERNGITYTRYADDLTLSTADDRFTKEQSRQVIGEVYSVMGRFGLSPNATKTRVAPPGSRKIVLGLLVEGPEPRLLRVFKATMRQHIHFLTRTDIGPSAHAKARGFASVAGLKHHVHGLVNFAKQIEPIYGQACAEALAKVQWPI